uniref:Uncharacterized protein n=1 Tax=Arundo donax TaxID=35708 RepID=A0A0A9EA56_ARUDO
MCFLLGLNWWLFCTLFLSLCFSLLWKLLSVVSSDIYSTKLVGSLVETL